MHPKINGLIRNESNADYHANKALSYSNLKMSRCPELMKKHMDGNLPSEHKDVWDIGTAIHDLILEPEKRSEFRLTGKYYNGAKKSGKKFKKKVEAAGCTLMSYANSQIVRNCVSAIQNHDLIKLIDQRYGEAELTWRVGGDEWGVQCRTDWMCWSAPSGLEYLGIEDGCRYALDLKSTNNIDDWFNPGIYKNPLVNDLLYAGQQKFYTDIINNVLKWGKEKQIDRWFFGVVEKREPFRVGIIEASDNVMDFAKARVEEMLKDYTERLNSGNWTDERTTGIFMPEVNV